MAKSITLNIGSSTPITLRPMTPELRAADLRARTRRIVYLQPDRCRRNSSSACAGIHPLIHLSTRAPRTVRPPPWPPPDLGPHRVAASFDSSNPLGWPD